MRKLSLAITVLLALSVQTFGQKSEPIEVLTLGSFHFNFPNLDVKKIDKKDQIDVLDAKYQKEIAAIVGKLAKFRPTIIVIECRDDEKSKMDAAYAEYLQGKHELKRGEEEQIGFRLGKLVGVPKLDCADEWGGDTQNVLKIMDDKSNPERQKIIDFIGSNPDKAKASNPTKIFKTRGILAQLRELNSPENLKRSLGDYLIGVFKYETADDKYFGPDFVTGWWFNRNLRIFRNIQKINAKPGDRIFVLFGAGHMNLLNPFFESSPEYKLKPVNEILK